jgi:hypothetical protein
MESAQRVITRLPLQELWRADGFASASRGESVTADDIRALLRSAPVHFVIAALGSVPQWIPPRESYHFWKADVQPHLAAPDSKVYLEEFPDGYAYFATHWGEDGGLPIIVLEKHH